MSASDHLNEHQWKKTTNRFGHPVEYSNTPHGGYVVDGSGAGRMKWSVDFPDGDYALGTTKGEVRGEAAVDLKYRSKR